jgi:hypothetical protein
MEYNMEDLSKFYKEGKEAFAAGKPVTSNPYTFSVWNAYHGLWRRGWTNAQEDSVNEKFVFVQVDKSIELF